uniref:Uncharacterized protein n=1 Tax=viral metagenome TaxID=1070528 RepID=A0A6M3LCR6_9ZZZZ
MNQDEADIIAFYVGATTIISILILLVFICYNTTINVNKAVEAYDKSCDCREFDMGDGNIVKDCFCPTRPDLFEKEMELSQ